MLTINSKRIKELEKTVLSYKDEKFEGLPPKYVCYIPAYVGYHARRFAYLAHFLEQLGIGEKDTILDVGPTFSSIFLNKELKCRVDTLSFSPDEETPFGTNYFLYTAPEIVLACLGSLLEPGGRLIVQTPNALALRKRVQLLVGKHPYEEINTVVDSPNHYRESTLKELIRYGKNAGLEVEVAEVVNYFNPAFRQKDNKSPLLGAAYAKFNDLLPQNLRPGCMLVYRKPL
jgi:hypothetical protein